MKDKIETEDDCDKSFVLDFDSKKKKRPAKNLWNCSFFLKKQFFLKVWLHQKKTTTKAYKPAKKLKCDHENWPKKLHITQNYGF